MPSARRSSTAANHRPPGPDLEVPEGESDEISPRALLLDPHNLRLLERGQDKLQHVPASIIGQKAVQDELFQTLLDDSLFDVPALERSIIYNGFLKHERLIVARYDGQHFLVLEGNRRLTAVKSIYLKFGAKLERLPSAVRQSLQTLPCFVLNGRAINGAASRLEEYRRASEIYIGMRHLMGAKRWSRRVGMNFRPD